MTASVKINVPGNELMAGLLGERDRYVRAVEDAFDASIHVRGNEISVDGVEAAEAAEVFEELVLILQRGQYLEPAAVLRAIQMVQADEKPSEILTDRVLTTPRGKPVRPKTAGQKRYLDAIRKSTITFGIGPAGTGKSWLAVACAIRALRDKEVERILLTRPAVEAGERLGYLPGDLMSKVDPYLR
ncbi:MAG: phosphate starvation-inducible protein PhoH, partial [Actinomycetia bacterium]|nr:phosphate starvation-inducible protein PhoH [Actinomycetes bacterium]